MVVIELRMQNHSIPWEHVLPDVDPRSLTAGRAKALLQQKLCISSRGMELLLGGWQPVQEDQRVQDCYASYYQAVELDNGRDRTTYSSFPHDSAEVAFDVDTGRLFYHAHKRPAEKKLKDEEELAAVYVLDKLVLHVKTTQARLPSQNLPWGRTRGTVIAFVLGPTRDVTRVVTLTTINKSTTLEALQSLIFQETGIESKEQHLRVIGGTSYILETKDSDRKYCWQQGIKSGSFLTVEKRWDGQIQIFCKGLTGRTITLNCYGNDLVEDVKRQIEQLEGITSSAQRLIHAGQQLQDGLTLTDCKVQREATLHLVLRLGGGMFHASSGRMDFEQLRALTTNLKVKMVRKGVCINERTVRIDGTTEARRLSEALAGPHSATDKEVQELEAKKRGLEEAIAALKQNRGATAAA
ncbi:ubiquitin C [Klebsormidium nitens]|uniref:Ubiquitin C n=1 Tax=Klebsormidium nitens TaxID=105231 RepID=A0A1Y1HJI6_KLENI|nr:ubiquitin C [Klebsormidium nitens]|eukprot:GAQ78700.1 ubiquitin C [Klebsormidium nitens]